MKLMLLSFLFIFLGCAVHSCKESRQQWMQAGEREKGYSMPMNIVIVPLP